MLYFLGGGNISLKPRIIRKYWGSTATPNHRLNLSMDEKPRQRTNIDDEYITHQDLQRQAFLLDKSHFDEFKYEIQKTDHKSNHKYVFHNIKKGRNIFIH